MNKRKIIRQSLAIALFLVGLWLFQLTATLPTLPSGEVFLQKLVNQTAFFQKTIHLPGQERENQLDFFSNLAVNRYGFLKSHQYIPEEEETHYLSPLPQPIIPEVETEILTEEVEGDWLSKTMLGNDSYLENNGIYVANNGKVRLEEEDLTSFQPVVLEKDQDSPQILIYHSHGTESYSQTPGYTYEESDPYRTLNMDYNITAVGKAMAEVFEASGYGVIHDLSLHDYPDYNSSYGNSAQSLQAYLAEYPSIRLIFDVHRDALSAEDGTPYQLVSQDLDGDVAQVMLVVGTDGGGYEHPLWEENFSLALELQSRLLVYGDYIRPIALRTSRFNQQYATGALLVEIGGHGNTFPQALAGGILFAEGVVEMLDSNFLE